MSSLHTPLTSAVRTESSGTKPLSIASSNAPTPSTTASKGKPSSVASAPAVPTSDKRVKESSPKKGAGSYSSAGIEGRGGRPATPENWFDTDTDDGSNTGASPSQKTGGSSQREDDDVDGEQSEDDKVLVVGAEEEEEGTADSGDNRESQGSVKSEQKKVFKKKDPPSNPGTLLKQKLRDQRQQRQPVKPEQQKKPEAAAHATTMQNPSSDDSSSLQERDREQQRQIHQLGDSLLQMRKRVEYLENYVSTQGDKLKEMEEFKVKCETKLKTEIRNLLKQVQIIQEKDASDAAAVAAMNGQAQNGGGSRGKQVVKVTSSENPSEVYEFSTNEEGELMAESVRAVFPAANAVKYKNERSGTIRVCNLFADCFESPDDGWGERTYTVNLAPGGVVGMAGAPNGAGAGPVGAGAGALVATPGMMPHGGAAAAAVRGIGAPAAAALPPFPMHAAGLAAAFPGPGQPNAQQQAAAAVALQIMQQQQQQQQQYR